MTYHVTPGNANQSKNSTVIVNNAVGKLPCGQCSPKKSNLWNRHPRPFVPRRFRSNPLIVGPKSRILAFGSIRSWTANVLFFDHNLGQLPVLWPPFRFEEHFDPPFCTLAYSPILFTLQFTTCRAGCRLNSQHQIARCAYYYSSSN